MADSLVAIGIAAIFATLGHILVRSNSYTRKYHIPAPIVGGLIGLLFAQLPFDIAFLSDKEGIDFQTYLSQMKEIPGTMINVVFASLMLGMTKIKVNKILELSSPNIVMGHGFAWGQHLVGGVIAFCVLQHFHENYQFLAPLIAIGFQGGHGTAAGLEKSFNEVNFPEAVDLGLGVATGGVLLGLLSGLVLFHFIKQRDHNSDSAPSRNLKNKPKEQDRKNNEAQSNGMIADFSIQLGFITLNIFLGYVVFEALKALEQFAVSDEQGGLIRYIPLFPIVMLTSIPLNKLFRTTNMMQNLDRDLIKKVGSIALDLLIVCAITTLDVSVLWKYKTTVGILIGAGLLWNILFVLTAGRYIYPTPWYKYALPDYGGATATTASGLLLADVADPEEQTDTKKAYTFKQPLYEPFMGGGLVTALSLPMIKYAGIWGYIATSAFALTIVGYFFFRIKKRRSDSSKESSDK